MKGPLEESDKGVVSSPVRPNIKSVDLGKRLERQLGIDGKIMIKQYRGQIEFSIASVDYDKLLNLFHSVPFFMEGDYIRGEPQIKGNFNVITMESHFRLRLLAHLFLINEEKKAAVRTADLIDKLRKIHIHLGNIVDIRNALRDFQWDPLHFMMLHEEALFCHHVRKLVQAHTLVCLADPNEKFEPKRAKAIRIDNLKAKNKGELECVIEVVETDCLEAARALVKKGLQVCVLNMANQYNVGGGYGHGAGAQEEDLCRRTDLLKSLPSKQNYDANDGFEEFSVLYSEGVTVFRKGLADGYKIDKPEDRFRINVVSSAAYNLKSERNTNNSDTPEYELGMKRKIRGQLRAAKANHDRALVLSAFGCGAFGNDSNRVAQFYLDVLEEQEFHNAFDYVQFAIIPNPSQTNNDNFTNFKRVFAGKGLSPDQLHIETHVEELGLN